MANIITLPSVSTLVTYKRQAELIICHEEEKLTSGKKKKKNRSAIFLMWIIYFLIKSMLAHNIILVAGVQHSKF